MSDEEPKTSPELATRSVPLVWILPADAGPIVYVNQMMSQIHEDGFVVSFGQVMPPLLLGSPEEVAEQAERVTFVESRTVFRISVTRHQMEDMVRLLTQNLKAYDEIQKVKRRDERQRRGRR